MKKYLIIGAAALSLGGVFTSCTKDTDLYDPMSDSQKFLQTYAEVFYKVFGQPAANQTWGFGDATRATRSQVSPACPDITQPYDGTWVANYNETAKEPNSTNVGDNYDNSGYATNWGEGGPNYIDYNDPQQVADHNYFFGDDGNTDTWEQRLAWALTNHPTWVTFNADEDYVRNFKITGTWNGGINVAGSEGLADGVATNAERTIVVTGTWNITEDQRIGSKGLIVIADGGTVNVAEGKTLNMVNQARLVVLPGGTLTGAGKVEVNNGNAEGLENYNGGTIAVGTFNNNFGKFYNYGEFRVDEYQGGAQESNFYNHALAVVDHFAGTGSTANARIFNACQFYVENNARIRNYEGVGGSALIVDGELMFSSSEDGTGDPTYVGLAAGALVQCNTLYNNGTSWTGPTSGYAGLDIVDKIVYLNWQQDAPATGGYFENNIYVKAGTWDNVPDGNGYHQTDASDAYNHSLSIADYKFFSIVANCRGNNGVTKVYAGTTEIIPADPEFGKAEGGCTPGFFIDIPDDDPYQGRIMAEDLNASEKSDFDFNDVVFDWKIVDGVATIQLRAAGGRLPLVVGGQKNSDGLYIEGTGVEVHEAFGLTGVSDVVANYDTNKQFLINTGVNSLPEPDPFELNDKTYTEAADIFVFVKKDGVWCELTAERGKAAAKINVKPTTKWVDEYVDITRAYPGFATWVKNPEVDWQSNVVGRFVDLDLSNND